MPSVRVWRVIKRGLWATAAAALLVGCHTSSSGTAPRAGGASVRASTSTESVPVTHGTPASANHGGHAATYVGPLTAPYHQSRYSITLAPPPSGATLRHSWQAAFTACFKGPVECVATGNAEVALASVTGPSLAGRLLFDHESAYVVIWGPTRCMASNQRCRNAYLVSDKTGSVVYGFDIPTTATFPG
jgi:hypothetical protein